MRNNKKDYESLRGQWERSRAAERLAYGGSKDKVRPARDREVVAKLRDAYAATGDRRFADAVLAVEEHGLNPKRIFNRHVEKLCIARMKRLRSRGLSLRTAAAQAAVEFHVSARQGGTFYSLVRSLIRAFHAAEQKQEEVAERGRDIGQRVRT